MLAESSSGMTKSYIEEKTSGFFKFPTKSEIELSTVSYVCVVPLIFSTNNE